MSVDILQEKIRRLKNPSMLELAMPLEDLPSQFSRDALGYGCYCRELLAGLKGIVPAVRVSFAAFALLGAEGLKELTAALKTASELGYYVALTKLQGEAGTKAIFTVARGKDYAERKSFSILRGFVTEQTVMHHVCTVDPSVGIVKILSFDAKTPQQFADAVNDLLGKGCSGFVFDVRNNPGGELNSICTILDALLPEGPVIRTLDRDGNEEVVYTSDKDAFALKMVVLVNENTASAGELFCSALQDYKLAPIVGVQTYGKGSMQTIRQLSDGSGVSVTYRYYCPPYSDNFDGVGVKPDVVVEAEGALLEKNIFKVTDEEDNQLLAALAELRK